MGQAGKGSGRSVCIGFCHPDNIDAFFAHSLIATLNEDWRGPNKFIRGRVIGVRSGPMIDKARNDLVRGFLNHVDKPEWLLMVDCDMIWTPEDFALLMKNANMDHPIIGGLCFANAGEAIRPTIFRLLKVHEDGAESPQLHSKIILNYPRDQMYQVDATGTAFLLIHRFVLEKIHQRYGDTPAPWFAFTYSGKGADAVPFGEDVTFCLRARQAGFPIYVHTGVKIGHQKTKPLTELEFDKYMDTVDASALMAYSPGAGNSPSIEELTAVSDG